jgi:hypothetical protein
LYAGTAFSQTENVKSYPFKLSYTGTPGDTAYKKIFSVDITEITFNYDNFALPEKKIEMPYNSIYSISVPTGRNTVVPIVQGSLVGALAGFLIGTVTHWPFASEKGSSLIYGGICTVIGGGLGYFLGSRTIGYREYSLKGLNSNEVQRKIKDVLRRNATNQP